MTQPFHGKIVIFGVGLIGGSFSLALRERGAVIDVVGYGRSEPNLQYALNAGILDRIGKDDDFSEVVGQADLILIATPVAQMPAIFARIAPCLGLHTLITDGGSTKADVVAAARAHLGDKISQFVPAHPIAGAEKSGAAVAKSDLYQGKKVVLTPLPENTTSAVARVRKAWEQCGAEVRELTPQQHDEVFAAVSHLPHLLSFALVNDLAQRDNRDLLMSFAASGFADFTRIAASSPEMWRDICLANREALLPELHRYIAELKQMSVALEENNAVQLERIFHAARELRVNWSENRS